MKIAIQILANLLGAILGLVAGVLLVWFGTIAYCRYEIAQTGDPTVAGGVWYIAGYYLLFLIPLGALGGLVLGLVGAQWVTLFIESRRHDWVKESQSKHD